MREAKLLTAEAAHIKAQPGVRGQKALESGEG